MIAPTLARFAVVAALAFGGWSGAAAQQPGAAAPGAAAAPLPVTPASLAAAKELLTVKGATNMFDPLIPGMVESIKNSILPSNPSLFKDLNEVAGKVRTELLPRRNEIVEEIARLYAQPGLGPRRGVVEKNVGRGHDALPRRDEEEGPRPVKARLRAMRLRATRLCVMRWHDGRA